MRSALNAVEMGKADLTLVYDGYDSGFTTVYMSSGVGLPIIAVNSARVSGDSAETLKHALQNISVHTSTFITGSAVYNAGDAGAYRRIAGTRKSNALSYQPLEPETAKVSLTSSALQKRTDGIAFNPFQIQYVPSMSEFDRKLEQRL